MKKLTFLLLLSFSIFFSCTFNSHKEEAIRPIQENELSNQRISAPQDITCTLNYNSGAKFQSGRVITFTLNRDFSGNANYSLTINGGKIIKLNNSSISSTSSKSFSSSTQKQTFDVKIDGNVSNLSVSYSIDGGAPRCSNTEYYSVSIPSGVNPLSNISATISEIIPPCYPMSHPYARYKVTFNKTLPSGTKVSWDATNGNVTLSTSSEGHINPTSVGGMTVYVKLKVNVEVYYSSTNSWGMKEFKKEFYKITETKRCSSEEEPFPRF